MKARVWPGDIGNRGDIANPFDILSNKFATRPTRNQNPGGQPNCNHYFRGRPAFFGGVSYQTPWQPLLRDGGARLNRRYTLYDLTSQRDSDRFDDNLQRISQ